MAFVIRVLRFLGHGLVVIVAIVVFGGLVPHIPILSSLGPTVLSGLGPWIVVLALGAAAVSLSLWMRHRRSGALVTTALAAFAAAGAAFVQMQQIDVARANHFGIDVAQAFRLGPKLLAVPPQTVTYSSYDGQMLPIDIYRPVSKGPGTTSPILVYIHGGGWVANSYRQRPEDYAWFVARGYVVIAVEYSLSSPTRHLWDVVQPQLGCALGWIGQNAGTFGGDLSRLAVFGESAGGNLAVNVSYMANGGTLHSSCAGVLPHVAAVIAMYPVLDVARAYRNPDITTGIFDRKMTSEYTGGTPASFPDRYAYVSSGSHISRLAPPTLLIVPEADNLVVPQAAYAFADQAHNGGVDTRLVRVPYAEHGFDITSGTIGNQLVRQLMLRFLDAHGLHR